MVVIYNLRAIETPHSKIRPLPFLSRQICRMIAIDRIDRLTAEEEGITGTVSTYHAQKPDNNQYHQDGSLSLQSSAVMISASTGGSPCEKRLPSGLERHWENDALEHYQHYLERLLCGRMTLYFGWLVSFRRNGP
jgi:hypothetical protein